MFRSSYAICSCHLIVQCPTTVLLVWYIITLKRLLTWHCFPFQLHWTLKDISVSDNNCFFSFLHCYSRNELQSMVCYSIIFLFKQLLAVWWWFHYSCVSSEHLIIDGFWCCQYNNLILCLCTMFILEDVTFSVLVLQNISYKSVFPSNFLTSFILWETTGSSKKISVISLFNILVNSRCDHDVCIGICKDSPSFIVTCPTQR
jgi:hypothetical protein